ncbi:hypothetical protein [Xanthomonas citri]|uniref:Uncharacterized protein n=1 Tax=Xanthomonas citri pv. citri TaxID=611301 RepID=A0A0U5F8V2_XANCI|nr:hypothetical protein [Xanthomonas citri]CEG14889.1 hypothetical protein XAC3562_1330013 [Xanthomonas citri pv. citri]CEH52925.1 hypothetical protein XACLD7_15540003 [Xanthomonas citri pv. citri]CEH84230.1 hypothetical protein XACLH37_3170002 [Xanthomonas citri pv. citri]CEH87168.1 hypothetical protein XAC3612_4120002 [Xanthomonas citri pv. citri]CEJ21831.1 hypothetical protein XACE116_13060002 [Xanthomonas citri pv. citri]
MQEIRTIISGKRHVFLCELRDANESTYEIVDNEGKPAPQSISIKINKTIKIMGFSGIKIVGNEVFSFEPIGGESHFLGHLDPGK